MYAGSREGPPAANAATRNLHLPEPRRIQQLHRATPETRWPALKLTRSRHRATNTACSAVGAGLRRRDRRLRGRRGPAAPQRRERLVCQRCRVSNLMRAVVQLMLGTCAQDRAARLAGNTQKEPTLMSQT